MPDGEIQSGTLLFKVRKRPLLIGAAISAGVAAIFLVLAAVVAANPEYQIHGRASLYLNFLPNPLRIAVLVAVGLFFLSMAFGVILRLLTSPGVFAIRPEGVLFESASGNWFAPWRSVRNVKLLKSALIIERDERPASAVARLMRAWRQARYGCDPGANMLAIGRLTAPDGSIMEPQKLAAIIEGHRRSAVQATANESPTTG